MTVRILFVCLGNICRSPTAEGVFRSLVAAKGLSDRVVIDSAGTGNWHIGSPPDRRSQAHALRRGIDLSGLRGRQVRAHDFDDFDLLVAMDRSNVASLSALAPDADARERIVLLRSFDPDADSDEVPDPYTGGADGFEHVLDLVEAASQGLLAEVERRLG